MTDENKTGEDAPQQPATQGQQQPQGEGQQQQANVQVLAQYIKDMSFENPNAPESLLTNWGQPETNVNVNIQHAKLQDNMFEVALIFRIEAKNKEKDRTAFIVELAYGATIVLNNLPEENYAPFLMIEVPKLLFPFAREIVATASTQAGYPPLYLHPINFEAIYIQEMQRQKAQAEQQGKEGEQPAEAAAESEQPADGTNGK